MTPSRIGLMVAGSAIMLGVLGDALLRETPWGLNLGMWALMFAGVVSAISQRVLGTTRALAWLILPVLFAMLLAWRDSTFLNGWNFLAMLCGFTLAGLRLRGWNLALTTAYGYVANALEAAFNAAVGALVLVFGDARLLERTSEGSAGRSKPVVIGIALAAPLLFVFGSLLAAADPVFERLVYTAFDWDFGKLASHLFVTLLLAWLAAGYMRWIVFQKSLTTALPQPRPPSLGIVEVGIPLGTMIALFAIFVTIQIQYLFGGEELIHNTLGLSYAEYARRGFFELVAVTALIAPVMLVSEWMLDRGNDKSRRSFAALATVLLVLVFIVMASALERMRLYVEAYGLTQDRFYATAFMLWIATVLGWLMATVLRGQRRRFAFGAIVSGFLLLVSLNVMNPDAIIARANINRPPTARPLDMHHLSTLSADAVPTILSSIGALDHKEQCQLIHVLQQRRWSFRETDLRSWNVARWEAGRALRDAEALGKSCESDGAASTNH